MAIDKLVDSSQLDNNLTSVANAIRTKGGTSASLTFPTDFVSAINAISGGGGSTLITKSITANGTYNASSDNADGYSSVTVNVSGSASYTTLVNGTYNIQTSGSTHYIFISNYTESMAADETYRVTWGGTTYLCTTKVDSGGTAYGGYYIGNLGAGGGTQEESGEPFLIYRYNAQSLVGSTQQTSGTVTFKLEKQVSSGSTPTLITKTITQSGTYSAEDDDADGYSEVTVNVTPNLQSKSATPTTSSQTVLPDNGYDGLSSVTVGAIPSQYIVPTGSLNIASNNTYDVTNYASAVVNVPSSASNIVTGTFKGTTTGAAMDVNLNYSGSGYPIVVMIFPSNADASTFQSTIQRYAVRSYMMDKYDKTSAPVYAGSTAADYAAPVLKYKSSTTNSRSLSNGGATNATTQLYVDESATADISKLVKIRSNKKLSVFIASTSYGFMANIEYSYVVIYSS